MMTLLISAFLFLILLRLNSYLIVENLAMRQQLYILQRQVKKPKIRMQDHIFWIVLRRFWKGWEKALVIIKPETVVRWHRQGFKIFWRYKSRRRTPGRPAIDSATRKIIEEMAAANPLWGAPRIHGELLKLGIEVSERTISAIIKKMPYQTAIPDMAHVPEKPHAQHF